jgi:GH24 family phage-related lysozyme (muramidase)
MSCTTDVVIGNAANETRHINACGASRLAGRVKAVITAVCFNLGLRQIEWSMGVAKILRVLRMCQSSWDYARCKGLGCHTLFFQKITVV